MDVGVEDLKVLATIDVAGAVIERGTGILDEGIRAMEVIRDYV